MIVMWDHGGKKAKGLRVEVMQKTEGGNNDMGGK